MGPSGQITKLKTLQDALKMVVSQIPDEGVSAQQLTMASYTTTVESKIAGSMKYCAKNAQASGNATGTYLRLTHRITTKFLIVGR